MFFDILGTTIPERQVVIVSSRKTSQCILHYRGQLDQGHDRIEFFGIAQKNVRINFFPEIIFSPVDKKKQFLELFSLFLEILIATETFYLISFKAK